MLPGGVLLHLSRQGRPGTDQRHIPLEDIEQLRQFIDGVLAKEFADVGPARVIFDFED